MLWPTCHLVRCIYSLLYVPIGLTDGRGALLVSLKDETISRLSPALTSILTVRRITLSSANADYVQSWPSRHCPMIRHREGICQHRIATAFSIVRGSLHDMRAVISLGLCKPGREQRPMHPVSAAIRTGAPIILYL
ncbi:hypothetical protein C8Q72DRAFT_336683 [Fomitopsis betulina]|nr:hypothetical protein C8Q72DRAFT_336683 [Fomitopsis betulina]